MTRPVPLALLACAALSSVAAAHGADEVRAWTRWGGPAGDFSVEGVELADAWPEEGPPRLWERPLGEGYSAIVAAGGRLYTMLREGEEELVVALDAVDGATLWEHRYAAPPYPEQGLQHGPGPHASPLLIGGRLVTVGVTGLLRCLDAGTGALLWQLDLVADLGATPLYYGASASPLDHDGRILVLVGGERHGVVALDPEDGSIAWSSAPCEAGYASPALIEVDGQEQVVFFTTSAVVGIDPRDGAQLWSHPVVNFCRTNCSGVVWGEDNLLWAASKGVSGARVLRLSQREGRTSVEQVWFDRKVRVYHWNAVRVGDRIYTSTGDDGAFLSVIDVATGAFVQKQRGYGSTNTIVADGKLILLDSEGRLSLARPAADGLEILSSVRLGDGLTWTVPTLVGTTLYVRDRARVMALDLGPSTERSKTHEEQTMIAPTARLPLGLAVLTSLVGAGLHAQETGLKSGAEILDRFVEVTGGKALHAKFRNRVVRRRVEHVGMDFEDSMVVYDARPNLRYVRIESEVLGTSEQGCDGKTAWALAETCGPLVERGEPLAVALRRSAFDGTVSWREDYERVQCTGVEEVGGEPCYRVELEPKVGPAETRWYAQGSGLLLKEVAARPSSCSATVTIEVLFGDYRAVDGLLYPHCMEQRYEACGAKHETVFHTVSIEHDVELPEDRFTPPAAVLEALRAGAQAPPPACAKGDGASGS